MHYPARLALGNLLWRKAVQPHLFRKDAEEAHAATIRLLQQFQKSPALLAGLSFLYRSPYYDFGEYRVGGVPWRNPCGLAAGFDKHAEVIPALAALGFGALEIGTVTPQPQYGNERPRVFRYPDALAIVNRYGFNSVGAEKVAKRLLGLHSAHTIEIPIGISLGKNKDTSDEHAARDYIAAYQHVAPLIRTGRDYIKINISSPNTPNLRKLFERLDEFLAEVVEGMRTVALSMPPLVLKVLPDGLSPEEFVRIVKVAARRGIGAIEATNTSTDLALKELHARTNEAGGLSGRPLFEKSTQCLRDMREAAREQCVDLIGVGGIICGEHALAKKRAGARAVQCYTGLVYHGPILVHEILKAWLYA